MSFISNNDNEYGIYSKYTNKNEKTRNPSENNHAQQSPREVDNINEIRKLIREQNNLGNKATIRMRNSNSNSSDDNDVEVPVRRFTPLPDIPRSDDTYFRTESKLIKDRPDINEEDDTNELNLIDYKQSTNLNYFISNNLDLPDNFYNSNKSKKETRYHFGSTNKIKYNQRLPALEKHFNYSLQNAMDLDEDLPMINESNAQNQRMVYTSPGDRLISPIKRPQAPSPAASAYRRKSNKSSDSDSDNDLIIS